LVAAAAITPTTVRGLAARGLTRENYRGERVAFPAGLTIPIAAAIAMVAIGPLYEYASQDALPDDIGVALVFVFGVAVLGLIDDLAGSAEGQPRGWRGHFGALRRGELSTGVFKAIGVLGLSLLVAALLVAKRDQYLLAAAVLVLATNVFNLLDLRPGRAGKALVILGAGLWIGSGRVEPLQTVGIFLGPILVLLPLDLRPGRAGKALVILGAGLWIGSGRVEPLQTVGIFLGPILVLLPLDLREVGMLGDTGSNVIGAVAGVWLVLTLTSTLGLAIAAGVLAIITLYGEFRSISAFIERTPGFRQLDLLGRSHA
jgi:UDP-N-acetylmuramyl pentapeptide phosphotransferase/UDP-N-acetylglucosamine-1-phosphate transferase